jgi:ATP-dependent RNA helicase DeaD
MDDAPATFADLALRAELLSALTRLGYEEPTPIQREAIPPLIEGRDLLGQAATGTGKTAAFALPTLQRLAPRRSAKDPAALVLVPTRELAVQVSEAIHKYGRELGVRVLPVYGGQPIRTQLRALERGVDVVVATPGRAVDHLGRGTLRLSAVEVVVLDEADEMLDMGFAEDLETILSEAPEGRQTVLFSATMPARISGIADRHLRDPLRIEIGRASDAQGETPLVRQTAYVVRARASPPRSGGSSTSRRRPPRSCSAARARGRRRSTETLNGRGYRAEALHGGMASSSATASWAVCARRGRPARRHGRRRPRPRRRAAHHVVNYDVPSAPEATCTASAASAGRARGRRDHRSPSPRAPDAQDDRAGHQPAIAIGEGARRSPTCGPAGSSSPAPASRSRCSRTSSTRSAWSSRRSPRSTT